jgi:enamine deaminase RidA (YjgF/YER057c/UK114 family)
MSIVEIKHPGSASFSEFYICNAARSEQEAEDSLDRFCSFVESKKALLPTLRMFVKKSAYEASASAIKTFSDSVPCAVTWILQPEDDAVPSLSLQAHAVCGPDVQPVKTNGDVVGCRFRDGHAVYLHLNVLADPRLKAGGSAEFVFDTMQERLQAAGSDFSRTVRTWLFADDILSWYGQLNQARDRFFARHDIFNKLVPASTGIGVANPFGASLTTELLSVEPLSEHVEIRKVISPLQCEALDYRSSFSRAVLIKTPDTARMYVSGTASIAPGGQTAHVGDCQKQVDLTMQVAEALIRNGGMDWTDTVQAIAYFKDCRDFVLFDAFCRRTGLNLPHVKIEADVCRDALLFELELALQSGSDKSKSSM